MEKGLKFLKIKEVLSNIANTRYYQFLFIEKKYQKSIAKVY